MAVAILNERIWFAQYHLSADHNRADVSMGHEPEDATVLTDTAKAMRGTLPFVELKGQGFVDLASGDIHEVLKANVNVANVPGIDRDGGLHRRYQGHALSRAAPPV